MAQIISHLRAAEVHLVQGKIVDEICRHIGVSSLAAGVRRAQGGPGARLTDLELENARLKRAVADLTLDKLILWGEARPWPQWARVSAPNAEGNW